MKNGMIIKGLLVGGTLLSLSAGISEAWSMMSLTSRCKENFIGRVHSVKNSQAPLSSLPKVDVEFTTIQTEDGNTEKDSQSRTITVVRDGPHKYEVGQVYDVGLNQGYVCRMVRQRS